VASGFIAAVLTLTVAVAVYWWQEDPTRWLPITFAVLAVTCPCALSLANPTAVAAAVGSLLGRGVVLGSGRALEALSRVDTVLIDKTGTLTEGRPVLVEVHPLSGLGGAECQRIAAALERHSEHPLAAALAGRPGDAPLPIAHSIENLPGGGLRGEVGGRRYVIGSPAHVQRELGHRATPAPEGLVAAGDTLVVLADAQAPRCLFVLRDRLRPDAADTVAGLRAAGLEVILASGDRPEAVAEVAAQVGIRKHAGALDPQGKLAWLGRLRAEGRRVCMVGDGVNDAPVLAAADASVAMGRGAPAAQGSADAILLGDRLGELARLIREARRTRRIIAQNLAWAALYNFSALPAAAAGLVAPWMAAIGMAASSLLVVTNSLRLARGAAATPGSPRSTTPSAVGGGNPPAASGAV
jgi:P-type Cu2+ transporter